MTDFQHLFSPIQIGHLTVKNRICCSAHADALAVDGMPQELERRYYEEKARGGLGFMMCFGSASIHETSTARDWNGVELFDDRVIPHLKAFSDKIHQYDVPVVCQITHRGRRGRSIDLWNRMYAPSDMREPNHRENPHPLDEAMMTELVEAFASAAGRLQQGGFDGCEVMASHCHLIDQFWTDNANRRDDDYGGELDNRLRFGRRVIDAVRDRVGSDFVVGIRVTGDDFTERGVDNSRMLEICRRLNADGKLDYFNVRRRNGGDLCRRGCRRPEHVVRAWVLHLPGREHPQRRGRARDRHGTDRRPGASGAHSRRRSSRSLHHEPRSDRRPAHAEQSAGAKAR